MLNPIVKRLAASAEKHERIMEHSRKALQGFDDNLIHRDMAGFPSLRFPDGDLGSPEIYVSPLQRKLFGLSHPGVQRH